MRTFLSGMLIAIPVTLVLTLVGLSEGMIGDAKKRANGVGADVLVRPKGSSFATQITAAPIPEQMVDFLQKQPHVKQATGIVLQSLGAPLSSAAGIDLAAFNRMSGGFRYLKGGPLKHADDILIDEYYARERKAEVGQMITLLNREWRVAGIVESGKLNRVFVDLKRLQDLTGSSNKLSQIYVTVDRPENIPLVVKSLKAQLVDYPIHPMEEFTSMFSVDSLPALRPFINVMTAVAVIIGFAVICLSMYMAVLQRTREFGILKSLGASRTFIVGLIVRESVLLSLVGAVIGILMSYGTKWLIQVLVPASLTPAIVPLWWPKAAMIAIGGAVLGALYPGWRAASQDPIEALAYE
jgi:putative ABC transport system permease protein